MNDKRQNKGVSVTGCPVVEGGALVPSNEAERSCGNSSLVMLHFRAGQGLLVPEGEEGQRSLQLHKMGSVLHLRQLLLTIVHCFVYFPNFFRSSI